MDFFTDQGSIVRRIWGNSDTVLFIFAGAAAEFALNKAVDWLYFTGKLPSDPLGRLFSTVSYARTIVFSENQKALKAIDSIAAIHAAVEKKRGRSIPDWAYRDVLFMLVDYSIRSFELLERPMTDAEKKEAFDVFLRVGIRMKVNGLPTDFGQWQQMRAEHLVQNMQRSHFTEDLFKQYRKHLGWFRYQILIESQKLVVPDEASKLLAFGNVALLRPLIPIYKIMAALRLDALLKALILPNKYKAEIASLDINRKCPFAAFRPAKLQSNL